MTGARSISVNWPTSSEELIDPNAGAAACLVRVESTIGGLESRFRWRRPRRRSASITPPGRWSTGTSANGCCRARLVDSAAFDRGVADQPDVHRRLHGRHKHPVPRRDALAQPAGAAHPTPLRMFWGHVNHETGEREADIRPIADWPSKPRGDAGADDVGDLSHQSIHPGDTTGKQDLVIAFRTRAVPPLSVDAGVPGAPAGRRRCRRAAQSAAEFRGSRRQPRPTAAIFGPIFFGQMEPDLVFFAFDIDPDDARPVLAGPRRAAVRTALPQRSRLDCIRPAPNSRRKRSTGQRGSPSAAPSSRAGAQTDDDLLPSRPAHRSRPQRCCEERRGRSAEFEESIAQVEAQVAAGTPPDMDPINSRGRARPVGRSDSSTRGPEGGPQRACRRPLRGDR